MRLTSVLQRRSGQGFQYWKRFVDRRQQKDYRSREWHPVVGWQDRERKHWYYDESLPWTDPFLNENQQKMKHESRQFVKPIKDWKIFYGDRVMILAGKDKGKIGLVNNIIKERNWVFVEGLNCEYELESTNEGAMPVCTRKEKPLFANTQVTLIDPEDNEATDFEWRFTEKGERVRVSSRTGRIIPLPLERWDDLVIPQNYLDNEMKDTGEKEVKEVTFNPKLCTFEEDIMESMGIKDDRKRKTTYWY